MTTEIFVALIIVIACIGIGIGIGIAALYIIHGSLIRLYEGKLLRQEIAEWQQSGGGR